MDGFSPVAGGSSAIANPSWGPSSGHLNPRFEHNEDTVANK